MRLDLKSIQAPTAAAICIAGKQEPHSPSHYLYHHKWHRPAHQQECQRIAAAAAAVLKAVVVVFVVVVENVAVVRADLLALVQSWN